MRGYWIRHACTDFCMGTFVAAIYDLSRFLPAHAGILSPMLVLIVRVAAVLVLVREQYASPTCMQ